MTLRHMSIFLAVYEKQSITRAAEALHMTQPAVTRAVQELERYYGVQLFERMNRRLLVTESGRALYGYACHLTETFDTMEKTLRNWDQQGVLRVGASMTLGCCVLPDLAARFRETYPGVRVQCQVMNGARLHQGLMENQLDLALVEGEENREELVLTPFSGDRLVCIVPPEHPLAQCEGIPVAELVKYDLLLREKGSAARSFLEHQFAACGLQPEPLWESASTQALIAAVSRGVGLSVLPYPLVRGALKRGEVALCSITDAQWRRTFYTAWHKSKCLTEAMKNFLALCMDEGD